MRTTSGTWSCETKKHAVFPMGLAMKPKNACDQVYTACSHNSPDNLHSKVYLIHAAGWSDIRDAEVEEPGPTFQVPTA